MTIRSNNFCYKLGFLHALFLLLFASCSSRNYVYNINLEKPQPSEHLHYENDTFSISFTFKPKYIEFEMYNKLEDGIRINWDELSLSINGEAKRVVHYQTGTDKITEVQPPTTIPPKSKLTDGIIPSESINFVYISGKKVLAVPDIYPNTDYGNKKAREKIMRLKGQKIVIYFPYYLRNIYHAKTFEFLIVDIVGRK